MTLKYLNIHEHRVRFSASDLGSDGRVFYRFEYWPRQWCLCLFLNRALNIIASLHPGVQMGTGNSRGVTKWLTVMRWVQSIVNTGPGGMKFGEWAAQSHFNVGASVFIGPGNFRVISSVMLSKACLSNNFMESWRKCFKGYRELMQIL